MQLFYAEEIFDGMQLDSNESGHAIRTLRKSVGDVMHLIDGKGSKFSAEIEEANPRACRLTSTKVVDSIPKPANIVHLAFAPPKSADRLEFLIEKCVEIGVGEFSPIICSRSERKKINLERLSKIMIAAIKQSGNYWLPKLHPLRSFSEIEKIEAENKLIAHCQPEDKKELADHKLPHKSLILIGPEGDFSNAELNFAIQHGFESVSLGTNRLRTETACIVASTLLIQS